MAASINMKHYIYKTIKQNKQFIRFCIVGGICTLLDASIYYLFCNSLGYTKSIIMGYLISLCLNYILTTYWTFSSKPTLLNAIGVIVVHLINCFIVRLGLMHLFIDVFDFNNSIAYIPTIIISILFSCCAIRFVYQLKS